jgi:uncharacterized protein
LYLPAMVQRKHGDVMIVASLAAFQPLPHNSCYAATKAFDLLFAEGIAEELRPMGVRVCALCPGSTVTEFQEVAHQPDRAFKNAETAEKVARVRDFRIHESSDERIAAHRAEKPGDKSGCENDAA